MRAFLAILCLSMSAQAQVTVVKLSKLIDGNGNVINNPEIVIRGDRIERIGSAADAVPDGATVIDLHTLTGLPGLVDVHTHETFYWDRAKGTKPWAQLGTLGAPAAAPVTVFLAQENARKTLEAGVTTVRDLGSWEYTDIAMRELINRGAMIGPRMFVAGYGLHISNGPVKPGSIPDPGQCTVPTTARASRDSRSARASTGSRCTDRPEAIRT